MNNEINKALVDVVKTVLMAETRLMRDDYNGYLMNAGTASSKATIYRTNGQLTEDDMRLIDKMMRLVSMDGQAHKFAEESSEEKNAASTADDQVEEKPVETPEAHLSSVDKILADRLSDSDSDEYVYVYEEGDSLSEEPAQILVFHNRKKARAYLRDRVCNFFQSRNYREVVRTVMRRYGDADISVSMDEVNFVLPEVAFWWKLTAVTNTPGAPEHEYDFSYQPLGRDYIFTRQETAEERARKEAVNDPYL